MKASNSSKYNYLIIIASVAVPIVVALLFMVKVDYTLPIFLPPVYATINALTAVSLVLAIIAIKNKRPKLHERLIKFCIVLSLLFLVMYILYHATSEATKYGGEGVLRTVYFIVLFSHIILSILVIPFVLITYVRGITSDHPAHSKIAKFTFPLWLYVAITGVVVYWMISPYYV